METTSGENPEKCPKRSVKVGLTRCLTVRAGGDTTMRFSFLVNESRVATTWFIFGPRPPTVAVEVYEGNLIPGPENRLSDLQIGSRAEPRKKR